MINEDVTPASSVDWKEHGSSEDLFLAIARAFASGSLSMTVGPPHDAPDKVNVAWLFSGAVSDLYDFNYFNRPNTSGHAAVLQAGWSKYSGAQGGPGQVFMTEYTIWGGKTGTYAR